MRNLKRSKLGVRQDHNWYKYCCHADKYWRNTVQYIPDVTLIYLHQKRPLTNSRKVYGLL